MNDNIKNVINMKKNINTTLGIIGMLCVLIITAACQKLEFSKDKAGFDEAGDLSIYSIRLFGFGNTDGERVADFGAGQTYNIGDAGESPQNADLIAFWSAADGVSFVSALDIPTLQEFSAGQTINSDWHVKNQTTFVRLAANETYRARYHSINVAHEVRDLYEWALDEVEQQPNYNEQLHGPYMTVKGLAEGDLLLARTESGVYVVALVASVTGGTAGDIRLLVKMDKRSYTAVPALDPNERMDTHEALLARPGSTTGAAVVRFLDVSTGSTYIQTSSTHTSTDYGRGVLYFQDRVDMVFLNSSSTNHNLRSPDNGNLGSWTVGSWIINDWAVRNSSRFIRLGQSEYADSLFTYSYQNHHIRDAWNEVVDKVENDPDFAGLGPNDLVTDVTEGDLILFRSESKNTYALIKVVAQTTGSAGDLLLSMKVDNSNRVIVPRATQLILTGVPGYQFIDFETGTVVGEANEEALAYGAGRFDVFHAKGSSSNHNLYSATSQNFGTFSAALQTRINAWPIRNRTEMVALAAGDLTNDVYRSLSDGDYAGMMAVWEAAIAAQNPVERLYPLAIGQVVLINSIDRGRFITARVLNTDNSQTTGSLAIEYKQATRP